MPIETAKDVPFGHLSREVSRMLERMSNPYSNFYSADAWQPKVNLYETEHAYLVCVELAGIDKEAVDLHLVGNRLELRGTRETPRCPESVHDCEAGKYVRAKVHVMEIDHGPFARDVELPADVQSDKITANYAHGVLWIEIPKK